MVMSRPGKPRREHDLHAERDHGDRDAVELRQRRGRTSAPWRRTRLPANHAEPEQRARRRTSSRRPVSGFNQSASVIELGVEDEFVVTQRRPACNRTGRRVDGGPTTPTTFATAGPRKAAATRRWYTAAAACTRSTARDPTQRRRNAHLQDPGQRREHAARGALGVLPVGTLLAAAATSTVDPTKIVTYCGHARDDAESRCSRSSRASSTGTTSTSYRLSVAHARGRA